MHKFRNTLTVSPNGAGTPMSSLDSNFKNYHRRARILSLDGGGVRGLVTLQILLTLEEKIKKIDSNQNIRTCFDLVCGTSTGGILAMALVATDMTIVEINELYKKLPSEVFTGWNWWNNLKVSVGSALLQNTTKYSPDNLEKLIDETFGENKTLSQCRNTANPTLKGFVTSTRIDKDTPDVYLFRNYEGEDEKDQQVHHLAGISERTDLSVLLKDALRATSAAPTYFPSIEVTCRSENNKKLGTFVDGGFLANNPVEVAVAEAYELWPTRGVSTILSLGTGDAMNESGGEARSNLSYAMTALELATESHRASARMETMTKIVRLMAVNEVRAGLEEIDLNNDGKISAEEFYRYLAKFGIHKGINSVPESMSHFGDENQEILASRDNMRELFKSFKEELDTYHDFPEYIRLNTPHTVNGRRIDLGNITLDTTDQSELDRMVDETNNWLKQPEAQAKLNRLAERLTHKAEKSVALIRTLSKTPLARHAPAFFRNLSEDSGLSSFDILDKTRTPIGVINEDDIFH